MMVHTISALALHCMDYFHILQNQATSVAMLDRQLCVKYLNESAEALMNTSLKQAEGVKISRLCSDDDGFRIACEKVLQGQGEMRLRNHVIGVVSQSAEKQIDCIVNRITVGEEVMLLLEISEVENMNKITRDEEFIQRQQSNQAMIRGLAHEIRNPLGGIRGAAQLLANEAGGDVFAEYTGIIIREADRLTSLVNKMGADAKVDLDQQVNIHQVLDHVRQLIVADGTSQYLVELDYDPSLPPVKGNHNLLIQAMINVFRNAVEAVEEMEERGKIKLRTRIDHVSIEGSKKQVVRVDIVDNGGGISDQMQSRVFDPMVTTKSTGTGLGLPITAEIVTQLQGVLDFHSKPGRTEFRLYLPVYEQPGVGGS